jgi:hypothetical protein
MKNMFLIVGLLATCAVHAEFDGQVFTFAEGKKIALVPDQAYSDIVKDLGIEVLRVSAENEGRSGYILQVKDKKALEKVLQYRQSHYQYWWQSNLVAALVMGAAAYATQPQSLEDAKYLIAALIALIGADMIWFYTDKTKGLSSEITVSGVSKIVSTKKQNSLEGMYNAQLIENLFGKGILSKWYASQTKSETQENIVAGYNTMYVPVSVGDLHIHDPKEIDLNVYKIVVHN